ncbi:IQ calmodulin-binding motif [Purpureocillium lavendulum]|uniref:IQ calmodulin-binding motif n=1 Tax=Purpureocillium lavendulum TaxID=1247861 RepID=A0AB34G1F0_9HYPO|nr:IQ calmodulin-binding motif [Purpureocillium lavendulum]
MAHAATRTFWSLRIIDAKECVEAKVDVSTRLPESATLKVTPFKAHVAEEKLQHFKKLLELSPIAPPTFENTHAGRKFGVQRDWLANAKRVWLNDFDWRDHENRINSFPNFKAPVEDAAGSVIDIQFLALFSERADAVPLAFLHSWPGSICEFLDVLDLLRAKYAPKDLPYHVIVPSLPGYAYSSNIPVDADYGVDIAAGAVRNLMHGLGFGSGYLVQGGDLGSFMARILAMSDDACRGVHLTMMGMPALEDRDSATLSDDEKRSLSRATEFVETGMGFALEQGTRAATVGLALSSSPLALLAWLGEKFLEWTDDDPTLEKILESVTLYWLTDTIPRCFYHNRSVPFPYSTAPRVELIVSQITGMNAIKLPYIEKPCGYSMFADEILAVPRSWATKSCNLVTFKHHDRGGHFAAMEQPGELLADVEEYVAKAWKTSGLIE